MVCCFIFAIFAKHITIQLNSLKMLVHTVFFWLKNPDDISDQKALRAGLEKLRKISEIKTSFVGTPAATRRSVIDSSYSFSITFLFDTTEQQDTYQTHADHLLFIDTCAQLWERVQVYDAIEA